MILKKILMPAVIALGCISTNADNLVILHTNDTHSAIDPQKDGTGGILRRKVIVDSVRNANDNVLVIDAGDALQGTLYFTLFQGEVERKLMDAMGYDIMILGNHEFDSGIDVLRDYVSKSKAQWLTTNYDLRETPLDSLFVPYIIKEYGGKKIAFIGINLNPDGMISAANAVGVKYLDGIKAANSTAWSLKHNDRVDMVIAVTHIGYNSEIKPVDVDIAAASEDIDLIIGGHSHTKIDPADSGTPSWKTVNALGDSIPVVQTGSLGRYVGEIDINLDNMGVSYRLIPVNSRLDNNIEKDFAAILSPYRHSVDSILRIKVGKAAEPLLKADFSLVNLVSDMVKEIGENLNGAAVDLAVMNKGGIRCDVPSGEITRGLMMQMMPFDNRVVILDITGRDLAEAFDVMSGRLGDGISGGYAEFDNETLKCTRILIGGKELDPERVYRIATIDYLATGGDYMKSFKNGKEVARSNNILYDDMINCLLNGSLKGKKLKGDKTLRMVGKIQ
ncbi:MAG: bifunctional metallophosphatase/5'-nucleotidase [Paramuribaculum sp.]|nr:bifunctional metallophosphatase/5'-nucleotidase [Paramuribaculum sp.]